MISWVLQLTLNTFSDTTHPKSLGLRTRAAYTVREVGHALKSATKKA